MTDPRPRNERIFRRPRPSHMSGRDPAAPTASLASESALHWQCPSAHVALHSCCTPCRFPAPHHTCGCGDRANDQDRDNGPAWRQGDRSCRHPRTEDIETAPSADCHDEQQQRAIRRHRHSEQPGRSTSSCERLQLPLQHPLRALLHVPACMLLLATVVLFSCCHWAGPVAALPLTHQRQLQPQQKEHRRLQQFGGDPLQTETWSHVLMLNNFTSSLDGAAEPWALVEFFASWCPACQYFKPQYERAAKLFNTGGSPNADFVYVAKVDCATEGELCARFAIGHYPTMLWAKPKVIAHAKRDGESKAEAAESGVEELELSERTAAGIVAWINKRTDRSFTLPDEAKEESKTATAEEGSAGGGSEEDAPQQPDNLKARLHDIEEATATAFKFAFSAVRWKADMREPLTRVLELLAEHHPSPKCTEGAKQLQTVLETAWPAGSSSGPKNLSALQHTPVCGAAFPMGEWAMCRGSRKDRRGYSCGLWSLFHTLSVRVEDEGGQRILTVMHDIVNLFFSCGPCRQHFNAMAQKTGMSKAKTRREAVLWVWRAHNMVNARLAREEAASKGAKGDPMHPKQQWPPATLCPTCYKQPLPEDSDDDNDNDNDKDSSTTSPVWDEDAVLDFLNSFYLEPNPLPYSAERDGGEDAGNVLRSRGRKERVGSDGVYLETTASARSAMVVAGSLALALVACCVYVLVRGPPGLAWLKGSAGGGLPRRRKVTKTKVKSRWGGVVGAGAHHQV